jgi:hypothetical protein
VSLLLWACMRGHVAVLLGRDTTNMHACCFCARLPDAQVRADQCSSGSLLITPNALTTRGFEGKEHVAAECYSARDACLNKSRVGHNYVYIYIYMVYIRYYWPGFHQMYSTVIYGVNIRFWPTPILAIYHHVTIPHDMNVTMNVTKDTLLCLIT